MESGDDPAGRENDAASLYTGTSDGVEVPPQSDRTFRADGRVGMITPGMPMAKIENLYGTGELVSREIEVGEGQTVPGYALFPNTHDELLIELGEDKQPATVSFSNPRSKWVEETTGLTIGTTLTELRKMNGKPFEFTGFGWDYGGTVTDWKGGKLEGILVRLTYAPERLPAEGLDPQLLGDVPVASNHPAIQSIGMNVREIRIDISKREAELR